MKPLRKWREFAADNRNFPQFLNKKAAKVFSSAVLAIFVPPVIGLLIVKYSMLFMNTQEESWGLFVFLVFLVSSLIQLFTLILYFLPINSRLKKRPIVDLLDLEKKIRENASDPVNGIPSDVFLMEIIQKEINAEIMEKQKILSGWKDIRYVKLPWHGLPLKSKFAVMTFALMGLLSLAWGIVLVTGNMPRHPTPPGIFDTTTASGRVAQAMRAGEIDILLGLIVIIVGLVAILLTQTFFTKMTSRSDEALKAFMSDMKIK
jgi:hypothetical protein